MTRGNTLLRVRILTALLLTVALLLIVRLYLVQVAHGDLYTKEAEKQYIGSVTNIFDRGAIYYTTKNGERVSAATLKVGYTLALNPDFITDANDTYEKVNAIVPMDKEEFLMRAGKKGDPYEEIKKRVPEKEAAEIRALGLKGVQLYRDQWRYYPGNEISAHTIGFVAYKENTLAGRYGLERFYDDILSRDSDNLFVNFFAEIFENFGSVIFDSGQHKQGHIVTTIEPSVARSLEVSLQKAHDTYGSRETGGIIINPKTGAIYAMSVYPNFNLNEFGSVEDAKTFNNPLVEQVHEMGSIIKPLTMASGIDSGAITRESTYYDAGYIELNGYTIYNFDKKGRGQVSMQEVLNQSLNTGVAHIVKTMGRDRFRDYFKALQFDKRTGIDLPGETYGLTQNLESPRDVEYATASFGQGIAMTPIETVRALSALGNGGELVTPHLVERIIYDTGEEKEIELPPHTRVFKESTSEEITRMLVGVVDTALAGGKEKMEHYTIAAKTGTAQIALPNGKGYYDDRYLHSFFGYFPAYDPQFLIFLYTVEPQNVKYASQTLTTPFMDLTKFLLNYYDVTPDR